MSEVLSYNSLGAEMFAGAAKHANRSGPGRPNALVRQGSLFQFDQKWSDLVWFDAGCFGPRPINDPGALPPDIREWGRLSWLS